MEKNNILRFRKMEEISDYSDYLNRKLYELEAAMELVECASENLFDATMRLKFNFAQDQVQEIEAIESEIAAQPEEFALPELPLVSSAGMTNLSKLNKQLRKQRARKQEFSFLKTEMAKQLLKKESIIVNIYSPKQTLEYYDNNPPKMFQNDLLLTDGLSHEFARARLLSTEGSLHNPSDKDNPQPSTSVISSQDPVILPTVEKASYPTGMMQGTQFLHPTARQSNHYAGSMDEYRPDNLEMYDDAPVNNDEVAPREAVFTSEANNNEVPTAAPFQVHLTPPEPNNKEFWLYHPLLTQEAENALNLVNETLNTEDDEKPLIKSSSVVASPKKKYEAQNIFFNPFGVKLKPYEAPSQYQSGLGLEMKTPALQHIHIRAASEVNKSYANLKNKLKNPPPPLDLDPQHLSRYSRKSSKKFNEPPPMLLRPETDEYPWSPMKHSLSSRSVGLGSSRIVQPKPPNEPVGHIKLRHELATSDSNSSIGHPVELIHDLFNKYKYPKNPSGTKLPLPKPSATTKKKDMGYDIEDAKRKRNMDILKGDSR
jgi:hypothetical protein